jgi:hypothetical protein
MTDPTSEPTFWVEIGIRKADLIAGFCGGVVSAFVLRKSDPWSIVSSVVVGALTASYLTEPIGRFTGTSGGTAAFIVGLAGMAICQGIVEAAKTWRPFNGRAGTDAKLP